jgi:hypothetical protein
LATGLEVVRGAYGGSLAAVRDDGDGSRLRAWLEVRTRLDRDAGAALLCWLGQQEPPEWPADGRGLERLGYCAVFAPPGLRAPIVLASARRVRFVAGGNPRRGRGRARPAVMAWRDGARAAAGQLREPAGRVPDVSNSLDDLERALAEVEAEDALVGWVGRLPRAHLLALARADPAVAIAALRARGPRTAVALRERTEAHEVPQEYRTSATSDGGDASPPWLGTPRRP